MPSVRYIAKCVRHSQNPLLEKATVVDASRPEPSSSSSNGTAGPIDQVSIGYCLCAVFMVSLSLQFALTDRADEQGKQPSTRPGKVPLAPGYSQMRWMQLSRTEDLSGEYKAPQRM